MSRNRFTHFYSQFKFTNYPSNHLHNYQKVSSTTIHVFVLRPRNYRIAHTIHLYHRIPALLFSYSYSAVNAYRYWWHFGVHYFSTNSKCFPPYTATLNFIKPELNSPRPVLILDKELCLFLPLIVGISINSSSSSPDEYNHPHLPSSEISGVLRYKRCNWYILDDVPPSQ